VLTSDHSPADSSPKLKRKFAVNQIIKGVKEENPIIKGVKEEK